ncbi:right-handed parallel beta-helix repeat-containing protein [Haloterrigena salinisoli]|uniref:right-handed parallel beta-helix repeat-containing protein n=1 Tax=Haloterrigena salinisoli TaxID=3132747 RepID=UPI0030CB6971
MARDKPGLPDENSGTDGSEDGEQGGNAPLLDRRSYLKLAGTASGAGAAIIGATPSGAAASEYDVIEADNSLYRLDDGEVFENKIIDFSNGNYFMLYGRESTNWTIRNVGFRGAHRRDRHAIVVADVGGNTSTIENVYMGDGCVRPSSYRSHGQCAIWVAPEHDGHIDIKNCNVQNWPNNGIYASAPGYNGRGGTVHIDDCYAANNYVSSYRLGSDGSKCTNSVAYNDGNGRYDGRCFWGWNPGEITVSDCDFSSGSYPDAIHLGRSGERTDVVIEATRYDGLSERGDVNVSWGATDGSSPDLSMPDGVPTTAEEAAGATGSSADGRSRGDHEDLQYTYEFVAEGESEPTDYYFEVEAAPVEPSTYNGATIEDDSMWISDDGTRAAGRVVDGRHAWEFDSLLVDVTVEGPADPFVDDSPSHLGRYPRPGATGDDWKGDMPWHDDGLDRTILIDGIGTIGKSRYEFTVTGDVEAATYRGASINGDDEIDGGDVVGSVGGWRDAFRFGGDLESLSIDGDARVLVDDEQVDPADYGDALEHVLTVVGNGSAASYEVSVSGEIEPIAWDGFGDRVTVTSGTAESTIESGVQRYRYAGSVTDLSFESGSAHVYADRDRITPDDF